ncbi:MAG: flagellar biosynthesis protein FlhA [Chlamydiales bacterium]|jgi:flagellar biosynthesis protein FlhA
MLDQILGKLGSLERHVDVVMSLAVVGIVMLLVVPLPPVLLDAFISISILLAVTTLLMTLYVEEAVEFNSFPSLLLFLTLFRLGLNIASTRMILAEAQAGDIIKTFGEFVTGGNQIVGIVIFILLTVINFVVITKGSGRVAEVAARFTLDAMPGKQMSIDADLNAGVIDDTEAKMRRAKITAEADFYGSMDGASKFVRGDAVAGIVITIVNIVGGLIIGMAMKGMTWQEAAEVYTILSVGDGLVSQIPALLISVGAGVIVTRSSSSKDNFGRSLQKQLFNNPRVLFMTSAIVLFLSMVPGMPMSVMLPISGTLGIYAYSMWRASDQELSALDVGMTTATDEELETGTPSGDDVERALFVDPMEIELGYGLIPLVDSAQGGDLLSRITVIRRQIASELGVVVPPIRIRDNMSLESDAYSIKIKGIEVANGKLYLDSYLAMNPGNVEKQISGIKTVEPAFGLQALWISGSQKDAAEAAGYTVVDTLSVIATHLTEVIHAHAHELINREEVSKLLDNAKIHASTVVEELVPTLLTNGQVLKVLQNLLKERIPVRDIVTILEVLADYAAQTTDTMILTEYVRQGLSRSISKQFADESNVIHAVTMDPKVEQMVSESIQTNDFGSRIVLRPSTTRQIIEEINAFFEEASKEGVQPIILTSPSIRLHFKKLIERSLPRLPVLSFNELSSEVEIKSTGSISSEVLM